MSDRTHISWTDASWNPLRARHVDTGAVGWACVRVSPGCTNCYAATQNHVARFWGTGEDYTVPGLANVEPFLDENTLFQPLGWKKPRRIFVCSMTDLFGEWVPDEWIARIFAIMARASQHEYQVLTKRPARMRQLVSTREFRALVSAAVLETPDTGRVVINPLADDGWPLPAVWLGVSAEDQERADERIPHLFETPAAVRFVSCEPLLGPLDLQMLDYLAFLHTLHPDDPDFQKPYPDNVPRMWYDALRGHMKGPDDIGLTRLDWVIVGGESGPGYRDMKREWALSLRHQCMDARVPIWEKQWSGAKNETPYPTMLSQLRQFPETRVTA